MARKLASLLLKEEMVADGKQRCKRPLLLQLLLHQNCAKRALLETRFTASLRSIIKEHEKEPRNCSHFQQPCGGPRMLQTMKFYFQLNFSPHNFSRFLYFTKESWPRNRNRNLFQKCNQLADKSTCYIYRETYNSINVTFSIKCLSSDILLFSSKNKNHTCVFATAVVFALDTHALDVRRFAV